jgi:hypothetical protein
VSQSGLFQKQGFLFGLAIFHNLKSNAENRKKLSSSIRFPGRELTGRYKNQFYLIITSGEGKNSVVLNFNSTI